MTELASAFHQDWSLQGDPRAVLEFMMSVDRSAESISALMRDATVLRSGLSGREFELLWGLCIDGYPRFRKEAGTGQDWLRVISEECARWFEAHPESRFVAVDPEPGWMCLDGVLAEIRDLPEMLKGARYSAGAAAEDATRVLRRCARECTPELALRFFLRVLVMALAPVSPERFDRLKHLGRAVAYGDLLVSSVEFLIDEEEGI